MDLGTLLLMVGFAYGMGVFGYDLLPGRLPTRVWRVAAYPFVAIVIAETLVVLNGALGGPMFGGIHIFPAVIASLIGVLVDWAITGVRHPAMVDTLEGQRTAAQA